MHLINNIHNTLKDHSLQIVKTLVVTLIFVLGATIALTIFVKPVTAGPGQPFGGLIYWVRPCTCSSGWAVYFNDLTISPPISLPLIYNGSTVTYQFGPPLSTGRWMLGTWLPGGVCLRWSGKFCTIIPTAGTMYMVGTSQ